jgi:predicted AAA+ superfamily ATPase
VFSYSKQVFESKIGAVLETYVVNALDAEYYFRTGRKEINVILKDEELLPIEVKETVNEEDISRFSKLVKYINARKGVIVCLNQEIKRENVEVIPAYMVEFVLNQVKR